MDIILVQTIVNGLMVGMIYVLMAIGFTMVFGIMRIVNFAHGEFYMAGAFLFAILYGSNGLPFSISVLLAIGATALLGLLMERIVFRKFRGNELNGMIASVGVALILQNSALLMWGSSARTVPPVVSGVLSVGGIVFPWSRLVVIIGAIVAVVSLNLLIGHTRIGRAMRAVAQDAEIAQVQGIRVDVIFPVAFVLGVSLAAFAGVLMAPVLSVSPFIGLAPTLKAFVIVVIGGLGSVPGAVAGGLLIGLIESFAGTFVSASLSEILQFLVVIAVVLLRPQGLLGRKEREA
ncbi:MULTISPECIES: branched-chain amino acid ABC transporter permease [Bradyrhizobium]|uniref:branched-chain amino acid ABC transporter permease n=1 Tax=Bradyrhizobium TaxID=374 RepID=UPI001FD5E553|nr:MULTISPECIES: branched-chain amino acid ABC transporter permease [Bradyrhizobium]MDA9404477.1 ABC transporter permease [Bradyrhizobium sp. CCBAU 45389]